jgi:hypothetical protein
LVWTPCHHPNCILFISYHHLYQHGSHANFLRWEQY